MFHTYSIRSLFVLSLLFVVLSTTAFSGREETKDVSDEVRIALESRLKYELAINHYSLTLTDLVEVNGVVAGIANVRHPDDADSIHNFKTLFAARTANLTTTWDVALPGEPELATLFSLLPHALRDGLDQVVVNAPMETQASAGHYYLPYPKLLNYPVTSDFDDDRCDSGYCAHSAIDFGLAEGHTVVAALDGEVVDLLTNSTVCCGNSSCGNSANFVKLYHASTGEYSAYLHFKPNSVPANIRMGSFVPRGTKIGEAGHSGWTWPACAGNHLHFHVLSGGTKLNPYFVEKPGIVYTGDNIVSQNKPSSCCGCSATLAAVDAPPLGGELIGPPDPQAEPAAAFDLTAPGDLSSALGLPEVAAEDTLPPQLDATFIEGNWSSDPAPSAFIWPAAVDEGSGVAGYHVYWGPDENGTAEALVTEAAYAPSPPDLTGGAAVYYLRVAPVDNVGNLGAWQTVNVQRYDAVAPAGTIEVSGGEVVPTLPVTLNLAATDEHSGIAEMRFSSDGLNWSEWEPYAAQRGWQLADVDGSQTIYVQFRDVAENMSTPVSAVVTADLTLALPSSTNYRIARSVMGMGGGTKNSSTYRLQGTSGQSYQTGQMQSGSYRVASGYWAQTVALSNQPPNAPSNPIPAQNATNIAITAVLSWSATDPDNDPLTHEVRFGTTNPPPQVVASQSATTYDPPGDLAYSTTYYWQIVASDGRGGETIGPVWSFTTDETADNTQPEVTWIAPAVAHNSYDAYGELVTLKANATDNRGVTKVRFDWWDNTAQQRVLIGEDTSAPYQINLNTNTLRPGCNIVNAGAFDAAGNFIETYIWICLVPPLAPTLSGISNPEQSGTFSVSWTGITGATGYELQERLDVGAWQTVAGVSGTNKDFTGKAPGTWCYQVSASNNAGAGDWSASQCTTVAGKVTFPNTFYISPSNNKKIGGIAPASADILRYEKSTNTWTMIYDGSVRGTPKNVSAFDVMDDGSLLLVFSANQSLTINGAKVTVTPYDVVKFTPFDPNVFPLGQGTYSWFFQGKPYGLTTSAEKIDAIDNAGNRLLLSTTGTAQVNLPGGKLLKPTMEDVFAFNTTSNKWESTLVIDGSTIPELKGKNINSVWDDPVSDDYYVTIAGTFKLGKVKGNAKSIVKLTPNGSSFTPSFVDWLVPGPIFPSNLDGLDIGP